MLMVMVAATNTTSTALQVTLRNAFQRVRRTATSHVDQRTNNMLARGIGATDGASDYMDFASRIRGAKHGPHRIVATHSQTDSTAISDPMPAFHPGYDGHRSQSALGSSARGHHEMSDRSYHSGPSIESGSS